MKTAVIKMLKYTLSAAFVTYKGKNYKLKKGIPTGGSDSRQIADIFLHWLLFVELDGKIKFWELIEEFVRFIDDVMGEWRGTEREFTLFLKELNKTTSTYGITFADYQIGKEVNFLDLTIYICENKIEHKLYVKPTDARRYLKPSSFHPSSVFRSVAYSQMKRMSNTNSLTSTRDMDMDRLEEDLRKSDYDKAVIKEAREKTLNKIGNSSNNEKEGDTIVLSITHCQELGELRNLIKEKEDDLKALLGENTKIMIAPKKNPSIGNSVVKNRKITKLEPSHPDTQKCFARNCKLCAHLFTPGEVLTINGQKLKIPGNGLNCKSDNVIWTVCSRVPQHG